MKTKLLFFSLTYEFLNVFLPEEMGRSYNTVHAYKDALTLFRKYVNEVLKISLDSLEFNNVNRECILGFMEFLKSRGSTAVTRNHRLAALKSYFWFASDKNISLQSLALEIRGIPFCKEKKKIKEILTEADMIEILKQPKKNKKGIRNLTFMILLYDTAARLNEILSLKISDLYLNSSCPYLVVNGKGNKQRKVSVTELTKKHILNYLSIYHGTDSPDTELVFYTVIHNKINKMAESTVQRFLQNYADSARIECLEIPKHVHPHMFRAYRATQMYQDGIDLYVVSRLLGHKQLETTKTYASPSDKMLRDAINSIKPPIKENQFKYWKTKEEKIAQKYGLR